MSINGFNIGGNIERVDYESLDNKPNIPDVLTAFKETEIDYTRIYNYYREQLEDITIFNSNKAFKIESEIVSLSQGTTEICKIIWYQFDIAIAMKEDGKELVRLVDSPLDIKVNDNGLITFTNTNQLKDIGVIANGYPVMYKEYIENEFMDGGAVTECRLSFSANNVYDQGKRIAYLKCWLSIYVPTLEVAETLKEEFDQMLENYNSTFLLKYQNIAETEIVSAPYLGGN